MGLDMYLYKKTYLGNSYKEPGNQIPVNVPGVKSGRVSEIVEQVGYWRKANQIHNWFINNCNDGNDECVDIYVSRKQLAELLEIVNRVLKASKLVNGKVIESYTIGENGKEIPNLIAGKIIKDSSVAKELLPTQAGFFFGGAEYDEYYYADLLHTKEILEGVLAEPENGADYAYRPSW